MSWSNLWRPSALLLLFSFAVFLRLLAGLIFGQRVGRLELDRTSAETTGGRGLIQRRLGKTP